MIVKTIFVVFTTSLPCRDFKNRRATKEAEATSKKLGMTAEETHDYFAMLEAH